MGGGVSLWEEACPVARGVSLLQEATLMKGFLSHWNFPDHSVYQLFPHPQIVPQSYCLILYTTAIQIQN